MRIIKKMDRDELIKFIQGTNETYAKTDFSDTSTESLIIEKLKIQMREERDNRGRPRKV